MAEGGITHETQIRVRYGEVDQMGVVYHGHYIVYFELGRTEMLRSMGATYREVEDSGTLLVVVETGLTFRAPARYDDLLTIRTHLVSVQGVRLRFEYEVLRGRRHLTSGFTVLAACDPKGRPRRMPPGLAILMQAGTPGAEQSSDLRSETDRKAGAADAVQGGGAGPAGEATAPLESPS
jgi:acyl-CoA thioester hydrolase